MLQAYVVTLITSVMASMTWTSSVLVMNCVIGTFFNLVTVVLTLTLTAVRIGTSTCLVTSTGLVTTCTTERVATTSVTTGTVTSTWRVTVTSFCETTSTAREMAVCTRRLSVNRLTGDQLACARRAT